MPRGKLPVVKEVESGDRTSRFIKWVAKTLGKENLIKKTTPVIPHLYVFEHEPVIRRPLYDYVNLFEVGTTSWPLRRAFRAIIQECTRNRWHIASRFEYKCIKCGKEYNKETESKKCENKLDSVDGKSTICEGELRTPNYDEYVKLKALVDHPNDDYPFLDIIKSCLTYDLTLDDFYLAIGYRRKPKEVKDEESGEMKILIKNGMPVMEKEPVYVYVEDARFIFPVADQWGHLGGYDYFCPECYDKIPGDQPIVSLRPEQPNAADRASLTEEQIETMLKCPYCGMQMEQTAYVQEIQGAVVARWTAEEIVHGSSSRVIPALFGNSKILTVWKIVNTILSMDDYNFEVYNEGKVGAFLGLPGYDQVEVDEINANIAAEIKRMDKEDIQTGRYERSKKIRTLMLGLKAGEPPVRIPVMEDLQKMQSLEFYTLYANAVSEVYGVTPTFEQTTEGGAQKVKIEVQNRTVVEHQGNFTEPWNEELLPRFGVHDWILVFNPVEQRDELRGAQVHQTLAAAAFTYLRGGFKVDIGADGNLVVSGEGELQANEPEGSRAREDRAMTGKPWRWEYGEAGGRTQGEQLELMTKAGMPISWYSLTQIRLWDRLYALYDDKDEVYVAVNSKEIPGTRTDIKNYSYAIASLMDLALDFVATKIKINPRVSIKRFKKDKASLVINLRRGFDPEELIHLANYFDVIREGSLSAKIDDLRFRLERVLSGAGRMHGTSISKSFKESAASVEIETESKDKLVEDTVNEPKADVVDLSTKNVGQVSEPKNDKPIKYRTESKTEDKEGVVQVLGPEAKESKAENIEVDEKADRVFNSVKDLDLVSFKRFIERLNELVGSGSDLKTKAVSEARAPFAVTMEKETLGDKLKKVLNAALRAVKAGKDVDNVISKAKDKAGKILEASYKELLDRAESRAKRRTNKKAVTISPDELKRLNNYKTESLEDFERILMDRIKRLKKDAQVTST